MELVSSTGGGLDETKNSWGKVEKNEIITSDF